MLIAEKEIDDIRQVVLDEGRRTAPLISMDIVRSMLIENLDFTKPILHSNLVNVIVKKVVPNTLQDIKWYLNLFPKKDESPDVDYKEVVIITID